MAEYKTKEYYTSEQMSGTYEYHLLCTEDNTRWKVMCFQEDEADSEKLEFMWEVTGVTIGYRDDNPNFPIQEPFTEETARAEFDRWRT